MRPIINYREEERECATTSGEFNFLIVIYEEGNPDQGIQILT